MITGIVFLGIVAGGGYLIYQAVSSVDTVNGTSSTMSPPSLLPPLKLGPPTTISSPSLPLSPPITVTPPWIDPSAPPPEDPPLIGQPIYTLPDNPSSSDPPIAIAVASLYPYYAAKSPNFQKYVDQYSYITKPSPLMYMCPEPYDFEAAFWECAA